MAINVTDIASMPVWWPDDIFIGIFFFILGICGAAIMVYLGEIEKLLGKSTRILEIESEIESKKKEREKIKVPENTNDRIKWEELINKDKEQLYRERNSVRTQGIILYVFIGGVIATILANSMIEAVAFGAGWTGLIGLFGIKKDSKERREKREEQDEEEYESYEKTLKENISNSYHRGYFDAIVEIANIQNTTADAILNKL